MTTIRHLFVFLSVLFLISPAFASFTTVVGEKECIIREGQLLSTSKITAFFDRGSMTFGVEDGYSVSTSAHLNNNMITSASKGTISGNSLQWAVGSNTIRYKLYEHMVKEEIIVTNPLPVTSFSFNISLSKEMIVKQIDSGAIVFYGRDGIEKFRAEPLVVTDAVGKEFYPKWSVNGNKINIVGDIKGAIYPIVIDPTFTKLPNPSTLPTGTAFGVAFSNDGTYMSVAYYTSPYLYTYTKNLTDVSNWTKLPNPATLPPTACYGVAFSSDSNYLASVVRLTIYKKNLTDVSNWTKLPDPSTLVTDGYNVAFSSDDNYMAVSHYMSPYVTIYAKNLAHPSNWTKLPNPATLPTGVAYDVAFSSDDNYMAVAHNITPFVTIYAKNLAHPSNWTKLPNPATLPTGIGLGVSFSNNTDYMMVGHGVYPNITIYAKNLTDASNWTKLANPVTVPVAAGRQGSFSSDDNYMTIGAGATPFVFTYAKNLTDASNWTKLADPGILPTGVGYDVAWYPTCEYLAVAHATSPYITIYSTNVSCGPTPTPTPTPTTATPTPTEIAYAGEVVSASGYMNEFNTSSLALVFLVFVFMGFAAFVGLLAFGVRR